jgi:hypothetical protein
MGELRTKKANRKYRELIKKGFLNKIGCNLCKEETTIKEFKNWRIIYAKFPWDRIAKVHHMIIPKRHTIEKKLNTKEKKEFDSIKSGYINKKYEVIAEGTHKKKIIPSHLHIHLIIIKD